MVLVHTGNACVVSSVVIDLKLSLCAGPSAHSVISAL